MFSNVNNSENNQDGQKKTSEKKHQKMFLACQRQQQPSPTSSPRTAFSNQHDKVL